MNIKPTHSYRATLVPPDMAAEDVQATADAGLLPTLRLRAHCSYCATAHAAKVSGKAVLEVVRIEDPAPARAAA